MFLVYLKTPVCQEAFAALSRASCNHRLKRRPAPAPQGPAGGMSLKCAEFYYPARIIAPQPASGPPLFQRFSALPADCRHPSSFHICTKNFTGHLHRASLRLPCTVRPPAKQEFPREPWKGAHASRPFRRHGAGSASRITCASARKQALIFQANPLHNCQAAFRFPLRTKFEAKAFLPSRQSRELFPPKTAKENHPCKSISLQGWFFSGRFIPAQGPPAVPVPLAAAHAAPARPVPPGRGKPHCLS